jgi:hypothetical protein
MVDDADLLGSDCKTAVTVSVAGVGTTLGAVNMPEPLIVPTVVFPPGIPFTCQLTAELPAFCTLTVNATLVPANGCAEAGETFMITDAGEVDEARPPQEFETIAASKETAKRTLMPEWKARGRALSHDGRLKRAPSRERAVCRCRPSGWGIGSVSLLGTGGRRRKLPHH